MQRITPYVKQKIINWLIDDDETYIPRTKFGPNSITIGDRDITDEDNSTTIYDGSTETIGDGNQSVDVGNIGFADVTGDGIISQAIEHGKVWADNGQLYSSIDSAESNASDLIIIGPGTFSENVAVKTDNLTLIGCGRSTVIDGTTDDALDIQANDVTIRSLSVKTTKGQGNIARALLIQGSTSKRCYVENVWVLEADSGGILLASTNSTEHRVIGIYCDSANIDGNDVEVDSNDNVVDDIIGTVQDDGTGNTVGETA